MFTRTRAMDAPALPPLDEAASLLQNAAGLVAKSAALTEMVKTGASGEQIRRQLKLV
jgi:hypothetical protein